MNADCATGFQVPGEVNMTDADDAQVSISSFGRGLIFRFLDQRQSLMTTVPLPSLNCYGIQMALKSI